MALFVPSEGLPPVPAKLVKKILKGEFVDMAELLRQTIGELLGAAKVEMHDVVAEESTMFRYIRRRGDEQLPRSSP